MATCAVESCGRPAYTRGWCPMHYRRWWVHGDAEYRSPRTGFGEPVEVRIWRYVSRRSEGCWLWTGTCNAGGYGQLSVDGRLRRAHRVMFELMVGPIPEGHTLDHECHNRATSCAGGPTCSHRRCVNPAHLVPRTMRDNVLRSQNAAAARWGRRTHCPAGHPLSGDNVRYRKHGARVCLKCQKVYNDEYRRRRAARTNG